MCLSLPVCLPMQVCKYVKQPLVLASDSKVNKIAAESVKVTSVK